MYFTDITDKKWLILEPFVAQGKIGRSHTHDIRCIINAVRYLMKSGCQYRLLPRDFPPWQTVYDYYLRWRKNENGSTFTMHWSKKLENKWVRSLLLQ